MMSGGALAMEPLDRGAYPPHSHRHHRPSASPTRHAGPYIMASPPSIDQNTSQRTVPASSPMVEGSPMVAGSPMTGSPLTGSPPMRSEYLDMSGSLPRSAPRSAHYMGGSPPRNSHGSRGSLDGDMYLEPSNSNNNTTSLRNKSSGYVHKPPHDSGVEMDGIHPGYDGMSPPHTPGGRMGPRSSVGSNPRTSAGGVSRISAGSGPRSPSGSGPPMMQPHSGRSNGVPPGAYRLQLPPIPVTDKSRPDSIATRSHEYEELPASRYQNPQYEYPEMDQVEGETPRSTPSSLAKMTASGLMSSTENLCHSSQSSQSDTNRNNTTYRKRQNPLYEERGEIKDLKKKPHQRAAMVVTECPCLGMMIVGAVAAITLLLVILTMVGVTSPNNDGARTAGLTGSDQSELQAALSRIAELEDKYTQLLSKSVALENLVTTFFHPENGTFSNEMLDNVLKTGQVVSSVANNTANINTISDEVATLEIQSSDMGSQIDQVVTGLNNLKKEVMVLSQIDGAQNSSLADQKLAQAELKAQVATMDSELTSVKSTVTQQQTDTPAEIQNVRDDLEEQLSDLESAMSLRMDDITKMPGPPGAGNLTQCRQKLRQRANHITSESTNTGFYPDSQEIYQNWVIMGVECTTDKGISSSLVSQDDPNNPGHIQYSCACSGSIDGSTSGNRQCWLYIWECPRIS